MKHYSLLFINILIFINICLCQNNNIINKIYGTIIDSETNEPIDSVQVLLKYCNLIDYTDKDGNFSFGNQNELEKYRMPLDDFVKFHFNKEQYITIDTSIIIKRMGNIEGYIELKKFPSLTVLIVDGETNLPIMDAQVTIRELSFEDTMTNESGIAQFAYIPFGEITIYVWKVGYEQYQGEIFIGEKSKHNEKILIKKLPPNTEMIFIGIVKDDQGNGIDNANVELKTSDTILNTITDKSGGYKFTIDQRKIKRSDYKIKVNRDGLIEDSESFLIPQPNIINNDFTLKTKDKFIGLVNPAKYLKERNKYPFQIGVGFGIQSSSSLTLGNISKDIRIIPPHEWDFENKYDTILFWDGFEGSSVGLDNYLIDSNQVIIDLPVTKYFDLISASIYGLFNISLRTTQLGGSGENTDNNLYLKNYIKPEFQKIYGAAYIYYTVKTKERNFFKRNSFSLPISIAYPVLYFGKNTKLNRRLILRIMGGTNILLPPKIELEAENGWVRYGSQEVQETIYLGEIKEIEWFWGFDFEGAISKSVHFNFQLAFVHPDYKANFKVPMTLQFDKKISTSFRIGISVLLNTNK